MAKRFIVSSSDINYINENEFEICGSEVKHIHVLRYNVSDDIIINEYICKITAIKKDKISLVVQGLAPKMGIPNIDLTLYVAVLKNDQMDFAIQKAVELGCKKIVPFFSANVIVKLDEKSAEKRKSKIQIIANEACKQCGRTDIVQICDFKSFSEIIVDIEKYELAIFAYEKESLSLKETLKSEKEKATSNITNIACIIGPEGGFTQKEADMLKSCKSVKSISLGERILRAQTAALNLISIIMYEFD